MGFSEESGHVQVCTFFPSKIPKNPHKKEGQSPKKWDSSVFDIKNRDCPSKIGTVGEYESLAHPSLYTFLPAAQLYCTLLTWDLAQPFTVSIVYLPGT